MGPLLLGVLSFGGSLLLGVVIFCIVRYDTGMVEKQMVKSVNFKKTFLSGPLTWHTSKGWIYENRVNEKVSSFTPNDLHIVIS